MYFLLNMGIFPIENGAPPFFNLGQGWRTQGFLGFPGAPSARNHPHLTQSTPLRRGRQFGVLIISPSPSSIFVLLHFRLWGASESHLRRDKGKWCRGHRHYRTLSSLQDVSGHQTSSSHRRESGANKQGRPSSASPLRSDPMDLGSCAARRARAWSHLCSLSSDPIPSDSSHAEKLMLQFGLANND